MPVWTTEYFQYAKRRWMEGASGEAIANDLAVDFGVNFTPEAVRKKMQVNRVPAPPKTHWTDEREAYAKRRWMEGASAGQIARELGRDFTASAVIGKIHRKGWKRDERINLRNQREASRANMAAVNARRAEWWPRARQLRAANENVASRSDPMNMPEPPPPEAVSLLDIRAGQCRWPIGDPGAPGFCLCGRKARSGPYCDDHRKVAYVPRPVSAKKAANELIRNTRRYA